MAGKGGRSQAVNQAQDAGEQSPGYGHFGKLEGGEEQQLRHVPIGRGRRALLPVPVHPAADLWAAAKAKSCMSWGRPKLKAELLRKVCLDEEKTAEMGLMDTVRPTNLQRSDGRKTRFASDEGIERL